MTTTHSPSPEELKQALGRQKHCVNPECHCDQCIIYRGASAVASLESKLAMANDAADKGAEGRGLGTALEECQKHVSELESQLTDKTAELEKVKAERDEWKLQTQSNLTFIVSHNKDLQELRAKWNEFQGRHVELHSIATQLAESLQRLWNDDEMGFLIDGERSECVQCGAGSNNALPIVHNEGCVQGYIYETLTAARKAGLIK